MRVIMENVGYSVDSNSLGDGEESKSIPNHSVNAPVSSEESIPRRDGCLTNSLRPPGINILINLKFFYVNKILIVKFSILVPEDNKIRWVLDITIAYPRGEPLDLPTIVTGSRPPCQTFLFYRLYKKSQVSFHSGNFF